MRPYWLWITMSLLLMFYSHANAEMLCREQNGAVFVREECRKAETRLNMAALGVAGSPGPKGERGPRGRPGPPGEVGASTSPMPEPVSTGAVPLWWPVWLMLATLGVVG